MVSALVASACGGPPASTVVGGDSGSDGPAVEAGRPTPAAPSSAGATRGGEASEASSSPLRAPSADVDLSIVFDPRVTGSVGWAKLPLEIPLEYFGNRGAEILDLHGLPFAEKDPRRGEVLRAQLASSTLVDASLVLDEPTLCSTVLRDAVAARRPARLLVSLPGGITPKGVACLAALATPRVYLAGCLHRRRDAERCDGDAELTALSANATLRTRVHGLAASLSSPSAVAKLGELPALQYLAVSPGPAAGERSIVDMLPFARLPQVRYLEASGENEHAMSLAPPGGSSFIAQLHTLRWNGELAFPLPAPCKLERASFDVISANDVAALGGCASLRELSTDQARFDSATPVAAFSGLERLHLRHWKADDLAQLSRLAKLRVLSLPGSRAKDFTFLSGLPQLVDIDLSFTSLGTLEPFRGHTGLYALVVDHTAVSDLGPLRAARGLVNLSVLETRVADLSVVAGLRALRELTISKTPVSDLRPLAGHPSLEKVTLYESQVRDVSVLSTLPKLKRAHVGGLQLPAAQVEALRAKLGSELVR